MTLLSGKNAAKCLLWLAALCIAGAELLAVKALVPLENRVLDFLVRHHASGLVPDPEIVIIDIDDASLQRMRDVAGSWPWPRSVHAELLDGLRAQQPRAIVFDLTFTEKDVYRPAFDEAFNAALAGNTNVYFPLMRLSEGSDSFGPLASQVAPWLGLRKTPGADPAARLAIQPPLAIDERYWRTGTINFFKDDDGIGRRYKLYMDVKGWQIPSLPGRVAADLGFAMPASPDFLLSWRGGAKAFQHIPYASLYDDFGREKRQRPADEFKGKIVLIGTDASGLNDLRATPISSLYPGVQILATAIDNLKNQRMMREAPPWAVPLGTAAVLAMLFAAFLQGVNVLKIGAAMAAGSALLVAAIAWGIGALVMVPAIGALILAWLYFFAGALQAYLAERRSLQATMREFGRFVNPYVVKQLMSAGGLKSSGESRAISVLFSDIRGFTTLSENRTPQEVVLLLNRYFTLQVAVVFKHGGTMDKFIGDCIMAFWGAPLDDARHAENAVRAALEMADVLQQFKKELGQEDADFDVGIGIHSGPAVVGLIGSEQRREFTAIGDTVNLASRIEGLTKGVSRILVSEETMHQCGAAFGFTPYGSFEVKGREQGVRLFGPHKGEL